MHSHKTKTSQILNIPPIAEKVYASKKKINKPFKYVVNLGGYIDHSKFFAGGKRVIVNHFFVDNEFIIIIETKEIKKIFAYRYV